MAKDNVNPQEIMEESAKEVFDKLDGDRGTILDNARKCAELTLPYILPPDGHTENDSLPDPYQNLGARLVNNLASKITFTLLPPNNPFFRLFPDENTEGLLDSDEKRSEANQIAVAIENEAQKVIAKESIGVPAIEMMKALIVTGNALGVKVDVTTPIDKGLKTYRLDNYVVLRDYRGNLIDVVTRETVSTDTLDDDLYALLENGGEVAKEATLYTRCVLKRDKWYEYQYINDILVEDSLTTYNPEDMPYMALRWSAINGHNYGVGLVEIHLGDFNTLEGAYQLLLEHASVAGRTIFGIKPGSQINIRDLQNAKNGDVIQGDLEQEVTVLRVDKHQDLMSVENVIEKLTRRLEQTFLAASSAVRESERTTATEIRYLANDLETSLGGTYTLLSQEFQFPLARLVLSSLSKSKNSKVDAKGFDFVPVTGIESLGRNNDLDKLRQFSSIIQETPVLQESIGQMFNVQNYVDDVTTACSLPQGRYIKSQEQIQQEQQAMQEQQLLMQGAGNGVDALTKP